MLDELGENVVFTSARQRFHSEMRGQFDDTYNEGNESRSELVQKKNKGKSKQKINK